jgi:hypothetical protein
VADGDGKNDVVLNWTAATGTPYETWIAPYYSGANAAQTADPDNDTVTNLVEYAFDTLPNNNASGPNALAYSGGTVTAHGQPTTSLVRHPASVDFSAVFGRRKDYVAAGLTYTVQFSADLSYWVTSTDTPSVVASDATIDAVSVPYPLFISTPSGAQKPQYFRVAVTMAP